MCSIIGDLRYMIFSTIIIATLILLVIARVIPLLIIGNGSNGDCRSRKKVVHLYVLDKSLNGTIAKELECAFKKEDNVEGCIYCNKSIADKSCV